MHIYDLLRGYNNFTFLSWLKRRLCVVLSMAALFACAAQIAGCSGTGDIAEPGTAAANPDFWSISRIVKTDHAMITLFDPNDLVHHEADPENWHRYDYGFIDDLTSGRFAAVLVEKKGTYKVRITEGPLSQFEQSIAGPQAAMRLRVRNDRLLLSGGDTWPSNKQRASEFAYDDRWIGVRSGDYQVLITALKRKAAIDHHLVFQLKPVDSITSVVHAPGVPQLIPGKRAGVAGLKAPGYVFNEDCSSVPKIAEWTPLSVDRLPLPGEIKTISMSPNFHRRGKALAAKGQDASIPLVVARNTTVGSAGVLIKPSDWSGPGNDLYKSTVTTPILCAVKILSTQPLGDRFQMEISAVPTARSRIPKHLSVALKERFSNWVRLRSDPAWRFISGQIRNAVDDQSLVMGIMSYMDIGVKSYEKLLVADNESRARFLLDMIPASGSRLYN